MTTNIDPAWRFDRKQKQNDKKCRCLLVNQETLEEIQMVLLYRGEMGEAIEISPVKYEEECRRLYLTENAQREADKISHKENFDEERYIPIKIIF